MAKRGLRTKKICYRVLKGMSKAIDSRKRWRGRFLPNQCRPIYPKKRTNHVRCYKKAIDGLRLYDGCFGHKRHVNKK